VLNKLLCLDIFGSGSIVPPFLTSTLERDEWSAACPDPFTPEEITYSVHLIEGWVGPRTSLDAVEGKKSFPCQGFGPRLFTLF
jgi:hypothetical protein